MMLLNLLLWIALAVAFVAGVLLGSYFQSRYDQKYYERVLSNVARRLRGGHESTDFNLVKGFDDGD
jgi:hypothetical protein